MTCPLFYAHTRLFFIIHYTVITVPTLASIASAVLFKEVIMTLPLGTASR